MAYVDPRSNHPVADRFVGEALAEVAASVPDQGTAVADATDASDVITQLNALLASLRTAGVIATE